jgi:hypothetical protein
VCHDDVGLLVALAAGLLPPLLIALLRFTWSDGK